MRCMFFLALLVASPAWAQSKTQNVAVTNFPSTQNVSGTVSVSNLPQTQQVGGEVAVSNLPAVQDVNVVSGCTGGTTQFLGFTAAQVGPAQNGLFPMKQACASEFTGSHICASEEIIRSSSEVDPIFWTTFSVP
jgi:hypothetical protein